MKVVMFFLLVICFSSVFAADYSVVFNQVDNTIITQESFGVVQNKSYLDDLVLERVGNEAVFLKKVFFVDSFDSVQVRFNLDDKFVLGKSGVFPDDYVVESDGRSISLLWNRKNVSKGDSMAFFVSLEDRDYHSFSFLWFMIIITLLVVFFIVIFFKKRRVVSPVLLLDSEKRVIDLLSSVPGNVLWQKNIQKSLGLSKSKTSRLVKMLELRGLLVRTPFGNTNKISLK